jgi:hypothetical protein
MYIKKGECFGEEVKRDKRDERDKWDDGDLRIYE